MSDPKTIRVPVMMAEDEVRAIDEWQHKMKLPSRSAAIRRAVQWGLLTNVHHHSSRNAGIEIAAATLEAECPTAAPLVAQIRALKT